MVRKRLFTRSADKRLGPLRLSMNLWALPLPTAFWGFEERSLWFGVALGGTGADDVVSVSFSFELSPWAADLLLRALSTQPNPSTGGKK